MGRVGSTFDLSRRSPHRQNSPLSYADLADPESAKGRGAVDNKSGRPRMDGARRRLAWSPHATDFEQTLTLPGEQPEALVKHGWTLWNVPSRTNRRPSLDLQ